MDIYTLLLWSSLVGMATAARILLLPFSFSSHVSEISNIGQSLVERGHEVHMLLAPSMPDLEKWKVSTYIHILP